MRLTRILAPAAGLLLAAAVEAQVRPPATPPSTPGTAPGTAPKSPGTGPTTPGTSPTTPGTGTNPATPGTTPGTAPGTGTGTPTTGGTAPGSTAPGAGGTTSRPASPATGGMANTLPAPLFRQSDVGRNLNLTDRQTTQLNAMTDRLQARYQAELDRLGRLSDTARAARVQELNRQFTNDWVAGAREFMTSAQLNRYQQLQLQFGRFNSLADPTVQRQLNLSADQQARLRDAMTWSDEQMRQILQTGVSDRDRALRQYGDYNRAYQDRLNTILTPDQRQQWREMTGDPFTFQPQFPSTTTGGVGSRSDGTGTTGGTTGGTGTTPPKP